MKTAARRCGRGPCRRGRSRAACPRPGEEPTARRWRASGSPLSVSLLQEAEPGRVRAAQGQGGVRELLQNAVGRGRHLLRQGDQRAVFGRIVGRAGRSPAQFSGRGDRPQIRRGLCSNRLVLRLWRPPDPAPVTRIRVQSRLVVFARRTTVVFPIRDRPSGGSRTSVPLLVLIFVAPPTGVST